MAKRNEYDIDAEALLPLITWLTDKYTSRESTSVTMETAQMLMQAIIYSVNETFAPVSDSAACGIKVPLSDINEALTALPDTDKIPLDERYRLGRRIVEQKVKAVKSRYEKLLPIFNDYGCQNYRDTILQGIPGFLMEYDPLFNPQDHILTLDYPPLAACSELTGVDLILEYIQRIRACLKIAF